MPVVKELRNAGDHWNEMVEPDFCDHQANQADLRRALHCAVSLNHMADWVYETMKRRCVPRSAFMTTRVTLSGLPMPQPLRTRWSNKLPISAGYAASPMRPSITS